MFWLRSVKPLQGSQCRCVLMWVCTYVAHVCMCGCTDRDGASSNFDEITSFFTYVPIGKILFKKQQKMSVVSDIPVTHISMSRRYFLLNPRKKHYILIVNYSLWYRVYTTETLVTLGFLVHRLHYITQWWVFTCSLTCLCVEWSTRLTDILYTDSFYLLCVTENPNFTTERYVNAENLLAEATSLDPSERTHQIKPHQDITFDNKCADRTIPMPICKAGWDIVGIPPPSFHTPNTLFILKAHPHLVE